MANYINTETGAYPVSQQEIQLGYPNTSFPSPFVPPAPYAVVFESPVPEYNLFTQGVREIEPVEVAGDYYQTWEVYDLSPEQIAANENQARASNKAQAESMLQATDWAATVDINNPEYSNPYLANQPEFLAYRSNVRKIAVYPPVVVEAWPVAPEEVWASV